MIEDHIRIELLISGEVYDLSFLLVAGSLSISEVFCNDDYRSALNSCRWEILYDEAIFFALRDAVDQVHVQIYGEFNDCLFDGVMDPVLGTDWTIPSHPSNISLEAVDFTEALDNTISQSVTFPAEVGAAPFWIYKRGAESASILYQLLSLAGLANRIADDAPDIPVSILHFTATEKEVNYRELIDSLLNDYQWTLNTKDGNYLTWGQTSFKALGDDIETMDERHILSSRSHKFKISKKYSTNNGVVVEWPKTKIMDDALLWRGSLPVSGTDNPFPGEPIAAGDYWPEDSDIVESWMDFETEFLDTSYLSGKERLKNNEIDLIASSGHYIKDLKDQAIELDPIEEGSAIVYEGLRARLRYKNTGGAAHRLYWSEIYGKALVQTSRTEATYPKGASNPSNYPATYIYDGDAAQNAVEAKWSQQSKGCWNISFSSLCKLALGQVVRVRQSSQKWDGYALVTTRNRQYDFSGIWVYGLVSTAPTKELVVNIFTKIPSSKTKSPGEISQNLSIKNALLKPGTTNEREDFEFKATTGQVAQDGSWDLSPDFYIKTGDDYLLAIDNNFLDVADNNIKKRALINGNGDFAITNNHIYVRNVNADGLNAQRCNIHGNVDTNIFINPALVAQPSSRAITSMQTLKAQEKRLAYDLCVWAQGAGISFNNLHRCEVSEEPNVGWIMFAPSTSLGAWGSSEIDCAVYFYDDNGASRYSIRSKSTLEAYEVQNSWIFGWPWFGTHTEYRWVLYGRLSGDVDCKFGDLTNKGGAGFVVSPVQSIDPSSINIEIPGYGVDLRNNTDVTVGGVMCNGFLSTWGHSIAFRCYFGSDYDIFMKKLPGNDAGTLATLASGTLYRGTGGAIYVK